VSPIEVNQNDSYINGLPTANAELVTHTQVKYITNHDRHVRYVFIQ
jgi:hypothetical protein